MVKGFEHARLACGCRVGFRDGVEGSPVTVVIERKGQACRVNGHLGGVPVYDHREALRPPTRLIPPVEGDYEEEG